MITITKQNDGVLFTFENSDKYLYGSGTIEVPFNSLSIIQDESDMITFRKAASNDIFLSARYDTDLGYTSKDDAVTALKELLFAEAGGGVTSGDVETMIDTALDDYYDKDEVDAALSGKASVSAVTAVANDVQTVSGQVATKVAITDFNAYSAATDSRLAEDEEVTAAALNDLQENKADTSAVTAVQQSLSGKQDTLVSGTNIKTINNESILGSGNITISGGGGQSLVYYTEDTENKTATINVQTDDGLGNKSENRVFVDGGDIIIESYNETDDGKGNTGTADTQVDINSVGLSIITYSDDGIDTNQTELKVQPMGAYINSEPIATEPYVDAALSGKADTSAVTAAIDVAISGKVDTSAITTAITSGSTDSEIPTAKAVYDATQGGGGVTVDPTLDTGSTNPVANSAITNALDGKQDISKLPNSIYSNASSYGSNRYLSFIKMDKRTGTASTDLLSFARINDKGLVGSNDVFSLVETSDITTSITSSSTNSEVAGAKAVYDAIQAGGGGGATYSAGTNISIDTANTINCTLNASNASGTGSLKLASYLNTNASGVYSVAAGYDTVVSGNYSFGSGRSSKTSNYAEASFGFYNKSNGTSSSASQNSGNTLFSVGNGTGTLDNQRHNAFEIRQNGDIYVNDGTNDVRLQDTILALGGLKFVKLSQSEYDALPTKDNDTLYIISNVVS